MLHERIEVPGRIMRWKGRNGAVDTSESEGVGGDHIDPWEVCSKISADSLLRSSNFAPSRVAVPHVYRYRGQRVHGTSGGGIGKKVSAENARIG